MTLPIVRPFTFSRRPRIPWVHHYPVNELGRDFVVGDLHGCVLVLLRALAELEFHPFRDRLFAVGDLVNRGPYSLETLELTRRRWFRSVLGNHEAMLIEHLEDPSRVPPYDPAWLDAVAPRRADRKAFADTWLPVLREMPRVIVVGTGDQRYNVVHAELIAHGATVTDAMIDHWGFSHRDHARHRALWGRTLIRSYRRGHPLRHVHDPAALSTTYCGHSIVRQPMRLGAQVFLDQGAFLGFTQHCPEPAIQARALEHEPGLVLAEPLSGRFWLAPSDPAARTAVRPIALLQPEQGSTTG